MTARKKKGVGFGISGVSFLAAGFVFYFLDANPMWLVPTLNFVGLAAGFFGFVTVYPDVEE